jgi:hypothetical protein
VAALPQLSSETAQKAAYIKTKIEGAQKAFERAIEKANGATSVDERNKAMNRANRIKANAMQLESELIELN